MHLKHIRVKNFKSFRELDLQLGKFNVLIGPNAAGKSNFIQIFKFIRDILDYGLENAVSLQGGAEYLKNINLLNNNKSMSLGFNILPYKRYGVGRETSEGLIGVKLVEFIYDLTIGFSEGDSGFIVEKDVLITKFEMIALSKKKGKVEEEKDLGSGILTVSNIGGKANISLKTENKIKASIEALFPVISDMKKFLEDKKDKALILETPLFRIFPYEKISHFLKGISIYDLDSKLPKKATQFMGKAELEENGENLAIVLKKILADEEKSRFLFNLVKDSLPFIEDITVEKFFDKYLQLMIKEKYISKQNIPSSMMSDGTIFIISLIIALYFEEKSISIFEEPERRIHPYLISKIIDMMKDASEKKQIITSTHNPEAVKNAGTDSLLLVTRDKEGFTNITRPHEKEEIQVFLKNEIGIEELYVQNLLGS